MALQLWNFSQYTFALSFNVNYLLGLCGMVEQHNIASLQCSETETVTSKCNNCLKLFLKLYCVLKFFILLLFFSFLGIHIFHLYAFGVNSTENECLTVTNLVLGNSQDSNIKNSVKHWRLAKSHLVFHLYFLKYYLLSTEMVAYLLKSCPVSLYFQLLAFLLHLFTFFPFSFSMVVGLYFFLSLYHFVRIPHCLVPDSFPFLDSFSNFYFYADNDKTLHFS